MSTLTALTGTELRLMTREWAAMLFAFVFPALMLVVLAGAFGTEPDEEFSGASPADYYVTAYIGIPIGALALIGLPVMIASYRERDILRRFEAFGVPTGFVLAAQAIVSSVLMLAGAATVLLVAAPTYGVPAPAHPEVVAGGLVLGIMTMTALGTAIGLVAPTARAAQALGLLLFLPMWLLGGGGPPRDAMSAPMAQVADLLPLTQVTAIIRKPWLFESASVRSDLLVLALWLAISLGFAALLLRRRP